MGERCEKSGVITVDPSLGHVLPEEAAPDEGGIDYLQLNIDAFAENEFEESIEEMLGKIIEEDDGQFDDSDGDDVAPPLPPTSAESGDGCPIRGDAPTAEHSIEYRRAFCLLLPNMGGDALHRFLDVTVTHQWHVRDSTTNNRLGVMRPLPSGAIQAACDKHKNCKLILDSTNLWLTENSLVQWLCVGLSTPSQARHYELSSQMRATINRKQ